MNENNSVINVKSNRNKNNINIKKRISYDLFIFILK